MRRTGPLLGYHTFLHVHINVRVAKKVTVSIQYMLSHIIEKKQSKTTGLLEIWKFNVFHALQIAFISISRWPKAISQYSAPVWQHTKHCQHGGVIIATACAGLSKRRPVGTFGEDGGKPHVVPKETLDGNPCNTECRHWAERESLPVSYVLSAARTAAMVTHCLLSRWLAAKRQTRTAHAHTVTAINTLQP